jgi:hypothetical protein
MDKQELLKEFGKKYTEEIYVKGVEYAKGFLEPEKMHAPAYKEITDKISLVVKQLTPEQKEGFLLLFKDVISSTMFSTMNIFDTEEKYQLIYSSEDYGDLNLQKIAEDNDYGNGYLNGEVFNWINNLEN